MLGAYRLALDAIRAAAQLAIAALVVKHYSRADREAAIEVLTPLLTEVVRAHRAKAYAAATELLESQAEQFGVSAPYVPAESGYSEESVRALLDDCLVGEPEDAAAAVSERAGQHVEDSARQTVIRSVEDGEVPEPSERERWSHQALSEEEFERSQPSHVQKPKAWARVLSGAENCEFCIILAARGPVYSSAENAGRERADTQIEAYLNSYHPGCDCVVVPVYDFGDWPGRDSYRELDKLYKRALENADRKKISAKIWQFGAVRQELRRMAEEGDELPVENLRETVPLAA